MGAIIVRFILTVILSLIGFVPGWCDSCGEMCPVDEMTYTAYVWHNTQCEGLLCEGCYSYFTK